MRLQRDSTVGLQRDNSIGLKGDTSMGPQIDTKVGLQGDITMGQHREQRGLQRENMAEKIHKVRATKKPALGLQRNASITTKRQQHEWKDCPAQS